MEKLLANPVFLVFACITITSVVSSVAHYWTKMRKMEMEAALKHTLLEHGMSAEEIVSVIEATANGRRMEHVSTRKS